MTNRNDERENNNVEIRRGDIFYIDIPKDPSNPRRQYGIRPCVIRTNNGNNKFCDIVDYVPLTSVIKKPDLAPHTVLESTYCLPRKSMALCEQWGSIDKKFIKEKIGRVSDKDMLNIDVAFIRQQGINIFMLIKNMNEYATA